jgi:hypothetical protein
LSVFDWLIENHKRYFDRMICDICLLRDSLIDTRVGSLHDAISLNHIF